MGTVRRGKEGRTRAPLLRQLEIIFSGWPAVYNFLKGTTQKTFNPSGEHAEEAMKRSGYEEGVMKRPGYEEEVMERSHCEEEGDRATKFTKVFTAGRSYQLP